VIFYGKAGTKPVSDREFRENVHPADLGGYAEVFPWTWFYAQYTGMAANPALLPGGKFGRKDENQFHVRALYHAGLGIEEHPAGAHISSLCTQFRSPADAFDLHWHTSGNSAAGPAIDLRSHS
jgi:hypothetical protein